MRDRAARRSSAAPSATAVIVTSSGYDAVPGIERAHHTSRIPASSATAGTHCSRSTVSKLGAVSASNAWVSCT